MKKSIVTIVAFMLLSLAGFAQGEERVYVRVYNVLNYTEVHILQEGSVTKQSIPAIMKSGERADNLKELGAILEKYYAKGFKVKIVTNIGSGASSETLIEYILERQ